jgi:hypothetical protein
VKEFKMKIESISIIEVKTESNTLQLRSGDIVSVLLKDDTAINPCDCTIRGRIIFIDTEDIELDCSKEYESNIRTIRFKDIRNLFKIN